MPMAELERDPEITPTSPAENPEGAPAENPEGAAGAAREGPKEEPKKEEDPQTPKEEPKEDPTMEKNRTKKRKNTEGEQKKHDAKPEPEVITWHGLYPPSAMIREAGKRFNVRFVCAKPETQRLLEERERENAKT